MVHVLAPLDGDCNGKVSEKVAEFPFFGNSDPCRRELVNQFLKLMMQKVTGLDPVGRHFWGHLGGIFGKPSGRKDTHSL